MNHKSLMTESLYSICSKNKAPFCVAFAIYLSLKLKYHDLKRMKTISFKQLSHLEKQKTFWTKVLPIVIRKIKPFRLLVASLGSRGYFFLIWSLIVRGEKPGKITETKSRTRFQPNYLRRAIFFTNFLFSSFE